MHLAYKYLFLANKRYMKIQKLGYLTNAMHIT